VYLGGWTSGSYNGAAYNPVQTGMPLPIAIKLDVNGNVQWTSIYPRQDQNLFLRVVTDNIGGVYWLMQSINCISYSASIHGFQTDFGCGSGTQYVYLAKSDTNGAFQYLDSITSGIVQSMTIDNTGLLTFSGDFNGQNSNSLHGLYPSNNNVYNGFIDQQLLSYNCSCGNLASLVSQMSSLLNITTS